MNDLETSVLELIGENTTTPDVFTDDDTGMAQIRDSLNDAIEEITMLSGSVQRTYPMLLRADQTFYRMDFKVDRFAWVTDAWLVSPKRRLEQTDLIKVTNNNPSWLKDSSTPQAYGQIGPDVFFVWPCPASELIVDLTCMVIPDRYTTDTDRIKLRSMFHDAAVKFAVGEYYASRGDAKQALEYHQKYLEDMTAAGLYPKSYDRPFYFRTEKNSEAVTG